jgi:hypothetical protein
MLPPGDRFENRPENVPGRRQQEALPIDAASRFAADRCRSPLRSIRARPSTMERKAMGEITRKREILRGVDGLREQGLA